MRQREEWFKSAGDQEWWKEEPYMRDWQEHQGSRRREDAKKWTAAYEHAAEDTSVAAATEEELDKRESYYRENWWKREKYLADFIANKECGAIWQTKTGAALADGEWWKADRFKKEYQSLKTSGEAFWKCRDCIDDYFASTTASVGSRSNEDSGKPHHFSGKKWTAATPAAASVGLGDEVRASDADLVERIAYYQSHWWKQTQFSRDYAVNGKRRGNNKSWSEGATGGPDQLRERADYFDPQWRKKVRPGYRAMLAIDADHVPHSMSAAVPLPELNERAQYYEENWWRRFSTLEEYAALGASARSLHAATVEAAYCCSTTMATTTTQHTKLSSKETARRLRAIDRGLVDDVWLHNDFFIEMKNASPFWQSPECVEDYHALRDNGQLWTRSTSSSAAQDSSLTAAEKSARMGFYKFHFWRTLRCQRDFEENGANGTLWTATEPEGKGTRASDAELRMRTQTFRMSSSVSAAQAELRQTLFHSHNADVEEEEDLHNQQQHHLESLESFSQLSEEHFHRLYSLPLTKAEQTEAYVQRFWWKAPEVRADYEACARTGGSGGGKLYRAATAAVAASGLGDRPSYQASAEHIASRETYFKSQLSSQVSVEREILPESLFSQQLEASRNLGTLFWVTSAYIADYVNHRESGKKWTAADAAAGSTSQGDTHRAPEDELSRRRMFYERVFWKAPQYALDFAQHGPASQLWKAASLQDSATAAPSGELELRLAYFTEPIREAKRRAEHFCKYFWRTPEAIADYELHGMKSRFILAATPAAVHDPLLTAAAAAQSQRGLQATPDEVEVRVQYFENRNAHGTHQTTPGARSSKESDLEDNSVVAQIAPMDDSWWRSETYAREYFWSQEPEFWKRPAMIEDYYNSLAAAGGTKQQWAAKNIAMLTLLSSSTSSPSATGGDWWGPASKAELEFREAFMKLNFWRAPKFQHDHHLHGLKGTLWTNSDASGRGQPVSRFEMNARSHLAYRCTKFWEQQHASSSPDYGRVTSCTLTEALDREEWYEQNWWKCDDIKQDVLLRGGDNSVLVRAATYEAYLSGEYRTDARYQASQSGIAARVAYFTATQSSAALDQEWWKCSNVITDFVNYGEEGAMWKSQTQRHARESIGAEIPALEHELHSRREWYRRYFWRSSEAIQQYCTSTASNQGSAAGKASGSQILWKAASLGGIGDAPPAELKERERWLQENRPVDSSEVTRRKEWYERQLSDEEKQSRRVWLLARAGAAKKIFRDELAECLRQLNDGAVPTTEQIRAIEAAVLASRAELAEDGGGADDIGTLDGISQEEFVAAVALTKFYLAATPEERQRAEAEALEALHRGEMARAEEEIGYLALEAEEELTAAGLEYVEEAELTAEESNFLEQMEEEEELRNTKSGIHANEDAMPVAAEAEAAYHEFYANNNNDDHEYAVNDDDEDDGAAEALIVAVATTEDNDESSPFSAETLQDLQQTLQDDNDEQQHQEESTESQHEDQQQEDEPEEPLRISLKSATNPQFFKAHFSCIQLIHSSKRTFSSSPSKEKRVWVIDHFTRSIYSYDKQQSDGKIKEQYAANALMQMVRSLVDSTLIHLLFLTGGSSGSGSGAGDGKVDLIFYNTEERQRFYETTYAIRPAIRVYAPDLVHPDHHQQRSALSTVIDAVGANSMRSLCFDQFGKQAMRELSGECSVNASPTMTECLTVWCGTLNLEGRRPTALKGSMEAALEEWMPRGSFDVYAVCVQEASFCGSDDKTPWIECVQQHLGKSYIALGHAYLWNTVLVVMIRMKHLLKVGSIDKSTAPTKHQKVCGAKGGVALSFHFMETSMCFVGCHLAARKEWVDMRNQNLADMFESLTLESNRSNDVYSQFDHLFLLGDFNYRSTLDIATTSELVAAERYTELLSFDQLTQQREVAGILYGVTEAPITFPPTFMSGGGGGASGDNAPSYCARIMSKSISPMVSSMLNLLAAASGRCRDVCHAMHSTGEVVLHSAAQPIPEFAFFNIGLRRIHRPNNTLASSKNGVAINKNEIIKRPQLLFRTTFTQTYAPVPCKSTKTDAPSWKGEELPPLVAVSQVQDYLEHCHIELIVLEGSKKLSAAANGGAHRGTAILDLFGRVKGQQGVTQRFEVDVLRHGKLVGTMFGSFVWTPTKRAANMADFKGSKK
ncbi:inositol 5-phosphatase 1, putative [Bodo saltans]|uniref:Inositol 5-phosphatase 1, putative n=1 Tax=Bodo saltans TaxID=75058 RepID=A0A0S4KHF0_BODSA|nr:inositol 5-phosphatase 1, putative [Bodo saltans]|eukprot:CUI15101.1 inositol 5-phosphatase 1, putative [Bodo saltans]